MQVGQALDRIGQGLLVDLGVLGPDAVADGAVGGGWRTLVDPSVYSLSGNRYLWYYASIIRKVNTSGIK